MAIRNLAEHVGVQGRNAEAVLLLRDVLEAQRRLLGSQHPATLGTIGYLATGESRIGHHAESLTHQREAMERSRKLLGDAHPDTRWQIKELATSLCNESWRLATAADETQRDPQRAVELAREAVAMQPDLAIIWSRLGVALWSYGRWQESVEALEKADSMTDGGDRKHRMFLAMAHWQLGNKTGAFKWYAEGAAWIAAHRSKDASQKRFRDEAEQILGLSELDRNELIAAYYEKVNVDDLQQLTDRGLWYQLQEKQQLAVDDFTAVLRMQPDSKNLQLWRSRGISFFHLAQYENALLDLSRAIEIKPNDAHSISMRALAYGKLGKLDSALADWSRVIEVEPSTNHRYFERAEVYRERGEYELALADIEKGFEIDALHDAASYPRARAFALSGDIYSADLQQFEKSVEQYTKAIDLEPTNANYVSKREKAIKAITAATVYPL